MDQSVSPFTESFVLSGQYVHLVALQKSHAQDLHKAACENRSSYNFTNVPSNLEAMQTYVESAISDREERKSVPFAVFSKISDRIVGTTRFGFLEYWSWPTPSPLQRDMTIPDATEIGWTWLASSSQRTPTNTEMKFFMLQFAFETWNLHRVTFRTDSRNQRSRTAIERIGGKLDGILRSNMPGYDGVIRDSALYSILKKEWDSGVKGTLLAKLDGQKH